MQSPSRTRFLTLLLTALGLVALVPASAVAGSKDRDRDGLSNKRERKIGTDPHMADTDRDALKDGREVKYLRTNPRQADTDGDGVKDGSEVRNGLNPRDDDSDGDGTSDRYELKGSIVSIEGEQVTIRARFGALITFTVDSGTFIEGADRDGDTVLTLADFRVGDRVEVNLSADLTTAQTLELKTDGGDLNDAEGRITAIEGETLTVAKVKGGQTVREWEFVVDVDTFLRAPDRDGSGTVTLADFRVGDEVEAHLSSDGTRALSLELEYDDEAYEDDDGYGDDDEDEVQGRIRAIDYTTGEITIERRGWTQVVVADGSTFLRVPDRDASGAVELADFRVGDEVEGRTAADGSTLLSLKYEGPEGDDNDGEDHGGPGRAEVEGTITALDATTVTIARFNGTTVTLTAVASTRYEVMDRDLSGSRDLADFQVGDRVEANYDPATDELIKLEYEGIDDDDDVDDNGDGDDDIDDDFEDDDDFDDDEGDDD